MLKPVNKHIIPVTRNRFWFLLKWIFMVVTLFLAVYEGTNYINSLRTNQYHFYAQWETRFPFIPFFIIAYFSTFFTFIFPSLFFSKNEINLLGYRYLFIIFLSGIIFLVFPTRLGFERTGSFESLKEVFTILYMVDKPYNLFPSLHISYSTITVYSFMGPRFESYRWLLILWLVLVSVSVIVVHQHHLADIAGGYAVAAIAVYAIRNQKVFTRI